MSTIGDKGFSHDFFFGFVLLSFCCALIPSWFLLGGSDGSDARGVAGVL